MTQPMDPDELLTRARQAITKGLQLAGQGDTGPGIAWLGDAAKAIEDLDAYLTMGGHLPSQWKRARPAQAQPMQVRRSSAAACNVSPSAPPPSGGATPHCTRLRGHDGAHKDLGSGFTWRK